jgi:hypothetical protein
VPDTSQVTWDLDAGDRAQWLAVNAQLSAPPPPPPRPPWWRRHARWIVVGLAADLLVGTLVLRWARDEKSTPERAVVRLAELVHDKDWAGARNALCAPDRARYSEADIEQSGRVALLLLRGVDTFRVGSVTNVPDVTLGPVGLPARRVDGEVVPSLGPPSPAHVTVVQEPTAWKVCLSAGGYGVDALGVDEPAGGDLLR